MIVRRLAFVLAVSACVVSIAGCAGQKVEAKPTPTAMSTQEHTSLAQIEDKRVLDEFRAAHPKIEPPKVKRIRFVSLSDWPKAMEACLNQEGFEVKAKDGGVGGLILDAQRESYDIAMFVCKIQFPVDPKFNVPFNDSQLNYLYDYYTGKLTACLEGAGISVSKPPSRQKFIESYGAGNWAPYNSAKDAPNWSELNQECPQIPDGIYG